jgi:hypothetical protein
MNMRSIRKARRAVVGALLLGGLAYSVLALNTKSAYASTCDCQEAYFQFEYSDCQHNGGPLLGSFGCPEYGGGQTYYAGFCRDGSGVVNPCPD